ncbi:hypothetical protein SRHO_G00297200 [Serrasalmus rhombeus]
MSGCADEHFYVAGKTKSIYMKFASEKGPSQEQKLHSQIAGKTGVKRVKNPAPQQLKTENSKLNGRSADAAEAFTALARVLCLRQSGAERILHRFEGEFEILNWCVLQDLQWFFKTFEKHQLQVVRAGRRAYLT